MNSIQKPSARLAEIEAEIQSCISNFFRTFELLAIVEAEGLWKDTHQSFTHYYTRKWGITRQRFQQLLKSKSVMENLISDTKKPNVSGPSDMQQSVAPLPQNESQTRPLSKLKPPAQKKAWNKAVASANGHQPSTSQIIAAVATVRGYPNNPIAPSILPPPKPTNPTHIHPALIAIDSFIANLKRDLAYSSPSPLSVATQIRDLVAVSL